MIVITLPLRLFSVFIRVASKTVEKKLKIDNSVNVSNRNHDDTPEPIADTFDLLNRNRSYRRTRWELSLKFRIAVLCLQIIGNNDFSKPLSKTRE